MATSPLPAATLPTRAHGSVGSGAHRWNVRSRATVVSLGVVVFAACVDDESPTAPAPTEPVVEAPVSMARAEEVKRGHEAPFHEIAQRIKGFGGYFYDEKGNLVAYLVDPSEEGRLRELLRDVLAKRDLGRREVSTGEIVVLKGDYSFLELADMRDRATHPVLDVKGAVWTDLDEAQNRFVVGVQGPGAQRQVEGILKEHRVPLEAVRFEVSALPREDLTLRQYFRPLRGGFQIQRGGGGICTLGFNAVWAGLRTFLTNSHCTSSVWAQGASSFYQNDTAPATNLVGVEINDPAPWSCGFLGIYRCRWSDAAVIYKNSAVPWSFGRVARTTSWGSPGNSGSITVNPNSPSMAIIGEYSFPTGGEMFDKVGRTTGWTYGFVKKTCVDMSKPSYAGPGIGRILCTDWATYQRGSGDSGSPVFRWYGSTVRLAGIHWGGISSGGTTYGILSAMWNIEADLGALTTS